MGSDAGEITAGLAESNGSLPPGYGSYMRADCRGPGSAPKPYGWFEYGTTFSFTRCSSVCQQDNLRSCRGILTTFFAGWVRCVTSKNWLDFGGDLVHVMLGLALRLQWHRFALCVSLWLLRHCHLGDSKGIQPVKIYTTDPQRFFGDLWGTRPSWKVMSRKMGRLNKNGNC